MKVLIVHAHNEPASFNAALKNLAVMVLGEQGHEVVVSDLYAQKFNPVATAEDFGHRANGEYLVYALEQRHNHNNGMLAADIQVELEKIKWADLIIFNFPLYWFGMPAIMKGWIDRVFVSGFCYGGRRIYDRGGLKGKRAMLAFSLGGQRHMFGKGAVHGEMEALLRPIHQGMLAYVGLEVLPPFIAYHVPYISAAERREYLNEYARHLVTLEQREALKFPRLDDFDESLRPLGEERGC
ncbi:MULTISPECIES: NAD(P)H-dependent oxidoreductase [Pseudomonas]|uniref:NAD(P)H-dependent oxidoreductase n=1 Tax=Pseudomonas TaxID=286 RepID=UPI000D6F3639|nr:MULTISPECIES: NAD(P)H-dependent oxidoreductase [unclassified Pseudomonas]MED5609463.1 NAD(P)H-dependent oxidoreductase [Pseudomonas sp. JH-2]PWU30101.1 NAD(P)H dehydrogenase [Pseudomonas sp. RW407]